MRRTLIRVADAQKYAARILKTRTKSSPPNSAVFGYSSRPVYKDCIQQRCKITGGCFHSVESNRLAAIIISSLALPIDIEIGGIGTGDNKRLVGLASSS